MIKHIILYRVDNSKSDQQLWYNRDGSFNPVVQELSSQRLVPLPMVYDEKYGKDGLRWISAASSLDNLKQWICESDAKELELKGYRILKVKVTQYDFWENHAVFTWESVLEKEELLFSVLY